MENIVYLFSSFLSCAIIIGLLVQFLSDRYEKAYENVSIYRIVPIAAVFMVTVVNQLRNPIFNTIANILAFIAISFFSVLGHRRQEILESNGKRMSFCCDCIV